MHYDISCCCVSQSGLFLRQHATNYWQFPLPADAHQALRSLIRHCMTNLSWFAWFCQRLCLRKKSPCLLQRRYFSLTFLVDVYTLHRAVRRLITCRVCVCVCVCVWLVCTSAKHPNWCFSFVDREISAHWKPQTTAGSNAKILIYFQIKYTEAILSNSSRKLFWFEITKLLIAVLDKNFIVYICYNFRPTFVPYASTTVTVCL